MLPGNILTSKADGLTVQMMYEQQSWTFDRDQSMNSKQSIRTRPTSNIQLCTSGRKNQSKLGLEEWLDCPLLVDFCPKWHPPYLAKGSLPHIMSGISANMCCLQRICSSTFQAEGGTDQSMDQLVDLGDSLRWTERQGGAEQLAMHCQWQ